MRPELDQIKRIDDYLFGRLTPEEAVAFEQEMNADTSLSEDVRIQQLANDIVIESRFASVMDRVNSQRKADASFRKWMNIGGILVLMIGAGLVYYFLTDNEVVLQSTTTEQLVETNASPIEESTHASQAPVERSYSNTSNQEVQSPLPQQNATLAEPNVLVSDQPASKQPEPIQDVMPVQQKKSNEPSVSSTSNSKPCAPVDIEVAFLPSTTCKGESEGVISIASNSLNVPNGSLKISLAGKDEFVSVIKNLSAGSYRTQVKDKNGCVYSVINTAEVKSVQCISQKKYMFNPEKGEVWEYPETSVPSKLIVRDKSGAEVYSAQLEPNISHSWNGIDNAGNQCNSGMYIFVVEMDNKIIDQGSVIIIR